ncbi:MAG: hypothetical protein ACREUZ_09390 [Burkholderiales bacterium]
MRRHDAVGGTIAVPSAAGPERSGVPEKNSRASDALTPVAHRPENPLGAGRGQRERP